ncbi:MAG TPA: GNAT family N-acetyltransferase [Blastocatellia bacterium]|nr:GNAT family N-acetyltransferase [Blastocatellia bacterium]
MSPQSQAEETANRDISVRPLRERDLSTADHIMRLAFGTFLGLPDPASFMGDASYVRTRWKADPDAAFAAEIDNELVGSNFASNWGSVGFFGPLTIRPDLWDRGVGKRLMEPVMGCFDRWQTRHAGLFTFAHSQKHIGLYQKFGFHPRFLTAIMSKPVGQTGRASAWTKFSDAPAGERAAIMEACRELTDAIYEGLDVGQEIRAVADQQLGDTLLLWNEGKLTGLAVCHMGPGTEAGGGVCYVKFGAARPGADAEQDFDRLLDACEEMASSQSLSRLAAGVNTARQEAYRQMMARGFRNDLLGVAMARPNEEGYNRPGVYLIDDWR